MNNDSTDLTAQVALRKESRRAPKGHVLLLEDQPWTVLPWLPDVLPDYDIVTITSLKDLRYYLSGHVDPKHPAGPHNPVAALIDLHFDRDLGGGSGISSVHTLLTDERMASITPIILTNTHEEGEPNSGNLHAVLCAYANGGSILVGRKVPENLTLLQAVVDAAASSAKVGQRWTSEGSIGELRRVPAVRFESGRNKKVVRHDLIDLLLGSAGLRALWGHYLSTHGNLKQALQRVRDEYPGLNLSLREGREENYAPANDDQLLQRTEFGDFIVAWEANGGRLWDLPDGTLRPYDGPGRRPVVVFESFAKRYGHLLASADTHGFAEWYMQTKFNPHQP